MAHKTVIKPAAKKVQKHAKTVHYHTAQKAHAHLTNKYAWYARWHRWEKHGHVHWAILGVYILGLSWVFLGAYAKTFAASDLFNSWDFSNPAEYSLSDGLEIYGNSIRMKAQNYDSDGQTAALFHIDESSGTVLNDSSSNANNATLYNGTFTAASLNNGVSFNGSTSYATAADGPSLSFTAQNSLEAWVQSNNPNAPHRQGIVDKGNYKLYIDSVNSKVSYELENQSATDWSMVAGNDFNGGWDLNGKRSVNAYTAIGNDIYAAIGVDTGDAEVWKYASNTWTLVGGGESSINGSWAPRTFEGVYALSTDGTNIYAGLGNGTGEAEVWRFNGTTWAKVGGDGVNASWAIATFEQVWALTSFGGSTFAAIGNSANDAEVWRFNGTTWAKVGGDGVNGGWGANFEVVTALSNDGTNMYAALGSSTTDAEVWRYNGTTWAKIGGDGVSGSWNTNYDRVGALSVYNGNLIAGLGLSTNEAEVWSYNGTTWAKIGGDGVSGSWNTNYESIESLHVANNMLYTGLGNSTDDAELWQYDGTTWAKIGGDDVNGSWAAGTYESVLSIQSYNGDIYVGLGAGTSDGEIWRLRDGVWSKSAGTSVNNSWGNTMERIESMTLYKGKLYAATGNTGNTDAAVWEYGDNGFVQSSTPLDTSWHHIAATYDGTTMRLFIDGIESATAAKALTMPDTAKPLQLGVTEGDKFSGYFAGSLDELRISSVARPSFTTAAYTSTPQTATLSNSIRKEGVLSWDAFTASEAANGGSIAYRISVDGGTTWLYWSGSAWAESTSITQANSAATISANINELPITFYGLKWQAVLASNGSQRVTLNQVDTAASSDFTAPHTNASAIIAQKSNGGSGLSSNGWTNNPSPYFSWTAGDDAESGVKGYCLYIGQDNTADPITTKGLLGNSPQYASNLCQYMVTNTSLDTAIAGTFATPLTTSATPYYIRIKTIDNAGNVSTSTEQFQFRYDDTPATNPAFITAPSGFVNDKTVSLSWPTSGGSAAQDTHSGVLGLQYKINGGAWYGSSHTGSGDINDLLVNDGEYTTQDNPDFSSLVDGINTIYFRTWDEAGNVSSNYVTAVIKLNTSGAPSEPQNIGATPAVNTVNSFAFNWDGPASFVGNSNSISYCYTINSLPSESTCSFTPAGVKSLGSGAYATQPGANTLYVVAKDESGNINYASYGSTVFTANTSAPGIALNVDIVDVSIKNTANWRLALTWDAPTVTGAGISSYKIYRSTNNVSFVPVGTSSSTTYIDAGLSQVRYYYHVRACDSTNNCGANSSTVTDIPTGKFTEPPTIVAEPNVTNITTKKATVRWSTNRSSDSKIAIGTSSGQYGSSEIASSTQTAAHEINLDNLSAGTTYYYVAKWTDEDGNTGVSQEYSFKTAPAPLLKEVTVVKTSLSTATIRYTTKQAYKTSILYGKSESFGGIKTINTSAIESVYEAELTGLEDGSKYFFKIQTYDEEGNSYDNSIYSFTTPARPKITNLRFQPVDGEPTSTQKVTWTTNVPSTSEVTYGITGGVGGEESSSQLTTEHEVTIQNLQDNSTYFVIAQSRDASGNLAVSDKQEFQTALDTRPPKITDISVESSIRGTGAEALWLH